MLDVVLAYWRSELSDEDKLLEYALRFGRGAVMKRLGCTAELSGAASGAWLEAVEQHLTRGVTLLDPKSGPKGEVSRRWRVRVNLPTDGA